MTLEKGRGFMVDRKMVDAPLWESTERVVVKVEGAFMLPE